MDTTGPSPRLLDGEAAWALLLAARDRDPAQDSDCVLTAGGDPSTGLAFRADGTWSCTSGLTPDASGVLDQYTPVVASRDLVIGQLGQSLDGRIATANGHSRYVTGTEDITRLHRLRALVDAVVVGARTVECDEPRLTVRHVEGPNPVRVILDPRNRLTALHSLHSTLFADEAAPTLRLVAGPCQERAAGTGNAMIETITLPARDGRFAPRAILDLLATRGLRRVLVEGGGLTVSGFLAAGVLDRLHVTVAPIIIGSGRPAFTLPAVDHLDAVARPRCRRFMLGQDTLFDFDLR